MLLVQVKMSASQRRELTQMHCVRFSYVDTAYAEIVDEVAGTVAESRVFLNKRQHALCCLCR